MTQLAPILASSSPLTNVIPGLMIWTVVFFLITFWVLKRFAFAQIQKMIDERREQIARSIKQAEQARDEATKLLEEHRQMLVEARAQAEQILEDARKVAESQRERTRSELDADRARRLAETERQISAETSRVLDQIKNEIAELTLITTAKVTGKLLTGDDQRRLIDSAVEELDFSALEESRN
jgi:F-type H+-transporting ATPase subunit b